MIRLALFEDNNYSYTSTLGVLDVRIKMHWNERTLSWYLSVYSGDVALSKRSRVEPYVPLVRSDLFKGEIVFLPFSSLKNKIGFRNIREVGSLVYFDELDLEAYRNRGGKYIVTLGDGSGGNQVDPGGGGQNVVAQQ